MVDIQGIIDRLSRDEVDIAVMAERLKTLDVKIITEISNLSEALKEHSDREEAAENKILESMEAIGKRVTALEGAKIAANAAWVGARLGVALTFAAIGATAALLIAKAFGIK